MGSSVRHRLQAMQKLVAGQLGGRSGSSCPRTLVVEFVVYKSLMHKVFNSILQGATTESRSSCMLRAANRNRRHPLPLQPSVLTSRGGLLPVSQI